MEERKKEAEESSLGELEGNYTERKQTWAEGSRQAQGEGSPGIGGTVGVKSRTASVMNAFSVCFYLPPIVFYLFSIPSLYSPSSTLAIFTTVLYLFLIFYFP